MMSLLLVAMAVTSTADVERLDGTTISPDSLTARIEAITGAARVHGLTVTVFNDSTVVYARAFGTADVTTGRPLDLDTGIYAASLAKCVFAVLVMRLVDRGVLDLDTPLQAYVSSPLWENPVTTWHEDLSDLREDPRLARITARMCLDHTTGLPNWRWVEPDHKLRIHSEPGARYSYSGEGMTLLQVVVEKLAGAPLEQLMTREIFAPCGMTMSSYTWQPRFEDDYCVGHQADGTVYPRDKDNDPRAPSTLETSSADYARFVTAVLRGDLLSAAARREMFTPQVRIRTRAQFGPGAGEETVANDAIALSYGLGWGLLKSPYGWGAFKEGHGDGFQHYVIVFPERGLGVLLMSNSDNAESAFDALLRTTIADDFTPLAWEGYPPSAP